MKRSDLLDKLMITFLMLLIISLLGTVLVSIVIISSMVITIGMTLTTLSFLGICLLFAIDAN